MGLLFDVVRQAISAREAAEVYGLDINQHGKARCPWHDDRRPSLSFKGNWCRCFACNNGGSAIDLTAQLYGITPLEAANKLNEDFHIGADGTPGQRPTGPSKADVRRLQEMALNILWCDLSDREQAAQRFLDACTLADMDRPVFKETLAELAKVQDWLNFLQIYGEGVVKEWEIPSPRSLRP